MNYINEAENIIKNFRKLQDCIENLEKRKNNLLKKGSPKIIQGIDYSKPAIQKQAYSEDTFQEICELMQLNNDIQQTEADIELINNILNQIKKENEILEKFIRIRYIEKPKASLSKIAGDLGYSEDSNHTIYEIRNKALKEFAIRYFGSNAVKNI